MKLEIEVKDCKSCPMAHYHRGHGECWTECRHPDHGREAYESILFGCYESFKGVPKWCPLLKDSIQN